MAAAGGKPGDLPVSEELSRRVLSLPLYAEMGEAAVRHVCAEVRGFIAP